MTTFEKSMSKKEQRERKFFVFSSYGELLDLAIQLQQEGEQVVLYVPNPDYKAIGDGIVEKATNWHEYLGKEYIFVIDGCENAGLQDWLRKKGEWVVGTNEPMSEYENNRQLGQELFKKAGFHQSESHNFTDFDDAIEFIQDNGDKKYVMKQNGDAPKFLNTMGKFDEGVDMLYHLEKLKKSWNESEYGDVDFDLMEIVEGTEMAASAFFNGHDWLRDEKGKVVGFLNQEYKKQSDGDLGEVTGEMGTVFLGVDEDNEIFKDILLRPEITALLKEHDYRGVFDINGSITKDGYVAFEPTSRFGIPATSYEFTEGLEVPTADLLEAMAKGKDLPIDVKRGFGIVQVVVAKPFPIEADVEDSATSIGKKLWILNAKGQPKDDFSDEQLEHIHLENFKKDDEGNYLVATKSGYLLTVTGTGDDLEAVRDEVKEYIKDNIYFKGMVYRQDLGKNWDI